MCTIPTSLSTLVLAAASLLMATSHANAAGNSNSAEAQTRYRQDMAVCSSGQSNQDMATCRREAGNALAAARRGGLTTATGAFVQNANLRCTAHEGMDRSTCEARMRGEGTTSSGSVGGGGILRESVTVVPSR